MKRAIGFFLVLISTALWANDPIGSVTYLEGYPEVIRNGGEIFDWIDFGFEVENYDQVETDDGSIVEIQIDASTGIDASVTVQPSTVFYFDLSSLRGEQNGGIELLGGSVEVVARRLVGNSKLDVRTSTAVMGVRGTKFSVTTAINGDILVTTTEGSVEVTPDSGEPRYAVPGQAVEQTIEGVFRNISIEGVDADAFRRSWFQDRVAAFDANASRVISFFGGRYLEQRETFAEAYRNLLSQRDIIDKWIGEDEEGRIGSRADVMREKRELFGELARIRQSLFLFERTYYRLAQMAPYAGGDVLTMQIAPGVDAGQLFEIVAEDRRVFTRRMAIVRYVMKLYALRNDGVMPFAGVSGIENDPFLAPDDGFFDDTDDFFGDEEDDFMGDSPLGGSGNNASDRLRNP